jgi:hypothetical protein
MGSVLKPPSETPFQLLPVPPGVWYRVHDLDPETGAYAAAAFNDSGRGNARFSPLRTPATDAVVPTIYAASTMRGAIMETVLHDVPVPSAGYVHDIERDLASNLHMSAIGVGALRLVNLTSTGLRAAGLKHSDLFDDDKSITRARASGRYGSGRSIPPRRALPGCPSRITSPKRSCCLATG